MSGKRTERLQVLLDDDELKALDDWRFKNRMPTRAAAIRELLRRGLQAPGFEEPEGAKSTDFSVVEADTDAAR
jgi:metal-responsive CopG/Arc/MetJ family transcriptional regulator